MGRKDGGPQERTGGGVGRPDNDGPLVLPPLPLHRAFASSEIHPPGRVWTILWSLPLQAACACSSVRCSLAYHSIRYKYIPE